MPDHAVAAHEKTRSDGGAPTAPAEISILAALGSEDPRVMDGEIWEELTDAIGRMSKVVFRAPGDPLSRAEGFRYLTRFLAAGIRATVEHGDGNYPELGRMVDITMPWADDCPDCLYLYTQINGPALGANPRYRLFGHVGTATNLDIQIVRGHYSDGRPHQWECVSKLNTDSIHAGPDGEVEILVSAENPGAENWLQLGGGMQYLQIRQYFGDWERERPADLFIERLDAPYPRPIANTMVVADQLDMLRQWISTGLRQWESIANRILSFPPNAAIQMGPPVEGVGNVGQSYGDGHFVCEPDEAVILELRPPDSRYWSAALYNRYWESLEFATRQTSLNHTQARPDSDGVVRMVLAHVDPGVPNWLDVAGEREGTVQVRYLFAQTRPPVEVKAVKLDDLHRHLPADTPKVGHDERDAVLTARRRAAWRRYRR